MGGSYGTYGEKRMFTRFWWGKNLRTKTTWKTIGIDRRIILKWILKK